MLLGKPIVTREGDHRYNRIGPAQLRQVGLGELVTSSEAGYLELAHRLIHDDDYRREVGTRISAVELHATAFSTTRRSREPSTTSSRTWTP